MNINTYSRALPTIRKFFVLLVALAVMLLSLMAGVATAKIVQGTNGNDVLRGTSQDDTMRGFAGNDDLEGRGGNDYILGYSGNDVMVGDQGADYIRDSVGKDHLFGGTGDDTIQADRDSDADFVYCGGGIDKARIEANDVIDNSVSGQQLLGGLNPGTSCETIFVNGIKIPHP